MVKLNLYTFLLLLTSNYLFAELSDDNPIQIVELELRSESLKNKWDEINSKDFDSLTKNERIWFTIEPLLALGILDQYINYGGEYNSETIEDLGFLGETEIINLMLEINRKFKNGVPEDIDERNDELMEMNEEFLERIDKKFWSLSKEVEVRFENFISLNFN
ncbi:MAG: DUF4375 domain-containing protein [Pseudomonadales bacterium]|nr:DUF4375 domain-containing protein [Pseudomonadales bacterium]